MNTSTKKPNAVTLLLSDARGQYIPRDFISDDHGETVNLKNCEIWHIKPEDAQELLDPANEYYWETWETVLNNAFTVIDGDKYTLYQDGDVWALCVERMSKDECENFGFEFEEPESIFEQIEYIIADVYACAIINGDFSGLEDSEEKQVNDFIADIEKMVLADFPQSPGYHWDIPTSEDDAFFDRCEISGLRANCVTIVLNINKGE